MADDDPAGRRRRGRHRPRGGRRRAQGPRRGRPGARQGRDAPSTTSARGAGTRPGRRCPTPSWRSCAATTRSCSAPSATRRSPAACSSGASAAAALRARPPRQPAPGAALPGRRNPVGRHDAEDVDMVVVREGTEGPYAGSGGVLRRGTPHEVATEESLNTAYGVERVVRDAFGRAAARPAPAADPGAQDQRAHPRRRAVDAHRRRGRGGVPRRGDRLPRTSTRRRCSSSPTRALRRRRHRQPLRRHHHRPRRGHRGWDRAGRQRQPGREPTNPSMFEPVHGSAPDIAGQGKATRPPPSFGGDAPRIPRSTEAARRVGAAVGDDLGQRGAAHSPREIGDALAAAAAG